MTRRQSYDVSPEEFCRVWQTCSSADEVAKKLRMPKPIVHARASSYRTAGIKLKNMPRRSKKGLDIDALNKLIAEIDSKPAEGKKKIVQKVIDEITNGGKK
jgi:hypothetical protein